MEETLKDLVSTYIKVPSEQITTDTVIDRSKVSSSIVLHRMYAKLAEKGFKVDNYWNIKTFGMLVQQNNGQKATADEIRVVDQSERDSVALSSGIDVEEIESMPQVNDFREDEFYKRNFAASEISYCILQVNPYASFAGLFALKEAIVKCDNSFKNREFNSIIISHSPAGKPIFRDFQVSLSHTDRFAVAMAIRINTDFFKSSAPTAAPIEVVAGPPKASKSWIAWLAILISLASIGITIFYINQS